MDPVYLDQVLDHLAPPYSELVLDSRYCWFMPGYEVVTPLLRIKVDWTRWGTLAICSINVGATNTYRIDLALLMRSRDVISPIHCMTFRECPTLFN